MKDIMLLSYIGCGYAIRGMRCTQYLQPLATGESMGPNTQSWIQVSLPAQSRRLKVTYIAQRT
jgi:hypothetical protein